MFHYFPLVYTALSICVLSCMVCRELVENVNFQSPSALTVVQARQPSQPMTVVQARQPCQPLTVVHAMQPRQSMTLVYARQP